MLVGWGSGDQLANAGNCPYPVYWTSSCAVLVTDDLGLAYPRAYPVQLARLFNLADEHGTGPFKQAQ